MTESIRSAQTFLKLWAGETVRHQGIDQSERFSKGGGVGGVKGICLETSAHQQINTTTHVRDVWSCSVCKIPRLFTYIHPSQQLYAMLAWIASMTGNAVLTLQQSGWAGDRTQGRRMLMETMHLWQKHPSSDMLIRTQAKMRENTLKQHPSSTSSHSRGARQIQR